MYATLSARCVLCVCLNRLKNLLSKSFRGRAIYKFNTSIVYQIYLVVKDEEITTPKYIEYELELNVGDLYQIEADHRWPSTTLQNFTWTTSDSSVALVSIWGTIRPQATGTVIVQGHYHLNERYYIVLRINVT